MTPDLGALVAFDPGLDELGWAVWRIPPVRPLDLREWARWFLGLGTIYTQPGEPLSLRLYRLHTAVQDLIVRHRPRLIVVEAPAVEGRYWQKRVNDLSMRRHAQATGAILAACAGCRTEEVRALGGAGEKESRNLFRLALGDSLPASSEHARVAGALGFRVLRDNRRQWAAA